MEWLKSSEIVATINYLLPGFLAAWIFYGLTAHPRREPFERVIQALIFTVFIQALNQGVRLILEWIGTNPRYAFGTWTHESGLVSSFALAVGLGFAFSVLANRDWCHSILRRCGITKRTSFPSEWFSAFNRDKRFIVLHLDDGRRLLGWPEEWPDSSECGHFVICNGSWLLDDNQAIPIHAVEQFLIPATAVKFVERCKFDEEIAVSDEVQAAAERTMISLQKENETNGKQSTGAVSPENGLNGVARVNGQAAMHTAAAAASSATPTKKMNRKARRRGRRR